MITIAVIVLVSLVGLLFASMAIAPALIEANATKPNPGATLVLIESPATHVGDVEHSRAA